MLVISTTDFRANQSKYLNMASSGENVVLKSRAGKFKLVPLADDDQCVKRDLTSELSVALHEMKNHIDGKQQLQSLDSLINEL